MKKILFLIVILCFSVPSYAQLSLRAGMGIQFQSTPSLQDYMNQIVVGEEVADFNSAANFSVEANYPLSESGWVGLELAYTLSSYTFNYDLGQYEFAYGIFMPSVLYYYVIEGIGYDIKFGGGAGVRFTSAYEKLPGSSELTYTATGVGFLLRADGNTLLGGNFYANIGGDIRYDFNGEPANNGVKFYNQYFEENVNLNSLSIGLRLGITYKF